MQHEKSAGIIIFRREKNTLFYLLLLYESGHWDFTKGLVEKKELELSTALREAKEETALKELKIIPGFKEKIHFFYEFKGQLVSKDVVYFLAESKTDNVRVSWEHIAYEWLPYGKAIEKATFKNTKQLIRKAQRFLEKRAEK